MKISISLRKCALQLKIAFSVFGMLSLQSCDTTYTRNLLTRIIENFDGVSIYKDQARLNYEFVTDEVYEPEQIFNYLDCFNSKKVNECLPKVNDLVVADMPSLARFIEQTSNNDSGVEVYALHVTSNRKYAVIAYFKGHEFIFIVRNLMDGSYTKLSGLPIFSPDELRFLSINTDLDAGYNPTVFNLYELNNSQYVLVFEGIKNQDNWGGEDPVWLDDYSLSFTELQINPDSSNGEFYIRRQKKLINIDDSWIIK